MSDPRRPGAGQDEDRMRFGQDGDASQDRNLAVQGSPDEDEEDMQGEEGELTDAVSALEDPEAGEEDEMDDEMDDGAGAGPSGGRGYT